MVWIPSIIAIITNGDFKTETNFNSWLVVTFKRFGQNKDSAVLQITLLVKNLRVSYKTNVDLVNHSPGKYISFSIKKQEKLAQNATCFSCW